MADEVKRTGSDYLALVEGVIDILGLYSIRHSAIGNAETRGISGGQRKRVNIGIELVVRVHTRALAV